MRIVLLPRRQERSEPFRGALQGSPSREAFELVRPVENEAQLRRADRLVPTN